MLTNLILWGVSLLIFVTYNAVAISMFGVPYSLSDTYYLFDNKRKGAGYAFTAMMWSMAISLLIAVLPLSDVISDWSNYLTWMIFFGVTAILFVGAAPQFKQYHQMDSVVHTVAAGIAAALCLLWCVIVCWKIAYILPIWMAIVAVAAFTTHTAKTCKVYWLEMVAFGTTFTTILVETILNF